LVDEAYPDAEIIRQVQDNLNTYLPGSLYDTFAPAEARRLLRKLEFHYTPVDGSWLNMAESEFAAIRREFLRRRAGDNATPEHHVAALEAERNEQRRTITLSCTAHDARTMPTSMVLSAAQKGNFGARRPWYAMPYGHGTGTGTRHRRCGTNTVHRGKRGPAPRN
jgi:hypothetical protein